MPLLRAGVREPAKTSLAYEGLDLIFEVNALIGVMAMVLVKAAIFGLVFLIGGGS